jgi:hypothetical protein
VVWVALVAPVPGSYRQAEASATGAIIRHIVAVRRIGTGLPRTGSEAVRAVIRLPNAKPVLGSKLPGRAGILPAAKAWATGRAV